MRSDNPLDERLDAVLQDLPVWTPPPGFARQVVAQVPVAKLQQRFVARPRMLSVADAVAKGSSMVAGGYLATAAAVALAERSAVHAMPAINVYNVLLERSIGALMTHSMVVAWLSAACSIAVGLSVRRR